MNSIILSSFESFYAYFDGLLAEAIRSFLAALYVLQKYIFLEALMANLYILFQTNCPFIHLRDSPHMRVDHEWFNWLLKCKCSDRFSHKILVNLESPLSMDS